MTSLRRYDAIVIGASAGGLAALLELLPRLPADYPLPIVVVQHLHPLQQSAAMLYQLERCALALKEADEKEPLHPGVVYFAPPNYHLLIEADRTLALSIDARVNFTRPSVDVLFESAAAVFRERLVGVILSGGNEDGAAGLRAIQRAGGLTVVQDPATAEAPYMPRAALAATQNDVDYILSPLEIARLLSGPVLAPDVSAPEN
ncbi:MAG: chemotaxis protein CheB [Anaerolineae bacterium]